MKKSQVKFGESIGVIIIVYIIIVIGLLWYNNVNNGDLRDMFERDESNRAYEKFQYIENLDLIHYSERGIVDEDFDINGLYSMQEYSNTTEGIAFFRKSLGESIITVDLYDYSVSDEKLNVSESITLYNYSESDLKTDKIIYRTLIPVYDEVKETYYIGQLIIEVPVS